MRIDEILSGTYTDLQRRQALLVRNGYRRVLPRELVQKRSARSTGDLPAPVDPLDLRVYPNPFNPVTTIRFRLPDAENVRVQVFTLQGREIARLLDEWRTAGMHSLNFEAGPSLPNGVYLVTVKAGAHRSMKRVTVLR
ncbi:MAG: T9SS type A sorting domain-containing protein [Ignavibacteriae bacterium]|nr:T9SS type A sorting domain-containing protein [Ignavibacteriota bacterium]